MDQETLPLKARRLATPWYHGWNIVAVCVLLQTASLGVALNCFSFFLTVWSAEFDTPISILAWSIPLSSVACGCLAPVAGVAADRYPIKRILCLALLGIVALHFLVSFATAGWQIILIYACFLPIVVTFASAIPVQTLVSRWFVHQRGLAFSLSAMGLVTAGIAFPPIVVWLMERVGWRATWWIFGAVILVIVLSALILVVRERPEHDEGKCYVTASAALAAGPAPTLRDILKRRNFWVLMAVFVPLLLANSAVNLNFEPFVTSRGLSSGAAAVLIGLFSASAAIGKLASGALSDRLGNRAPLVLVAALGTAGTFVLAFCSEPALIAVGFAVLGFSQGIWVLLASCTAAEFGSGGFPRAYGVASAFSIFGTFSSPYLAWIKESSGSYEFGLLTLGALSCIALVAAFFLTEARSTRTAPVAQI